MDIVDLQNSLDGLSAWRKNELLQAHFLAENAEYEHEEFSNFCERLKKRGTQ